MAAADSALRSRHGGRPGSGAAPNGTRRSSSNSNRASSSAGSTRRTTGSSSHQSGGKARRPAAALAWWAIVLLALSTVLVLMMGKRGVRRGLNEMKRLFDASKGSSGSKAGGSIRGGNAIVSGNDITDKSQYVDQALLDPAHGQRREAVDAALHAASATSSYQSPAGEPRDDPTNLADHLGSRLHVVFSTDCGTYQHWQSYLLFYSALRVGQPGRVTRIASGCKDDEEAEARRWFDQHVRPMSPRFGVHFTPHFSKVVDENGEEKSDYTTKFFNKPFGLRHWLEHGEGMGLDETTDKMRDEDVVVILIDPDMLFLRPITSDYSNDRDVVLGKLPAKDAAKGNRYMKVEKGKPFGQTYGFGNQWRKNVDVSKIVGEDSPALKVSDEFARLHYPVGPPYLAVASDMHTIAVGWTDVVPHVHKQYPNLLAEMFGFCLAAAHNELPHQRLDSLMVSAVDMNGGEGWEMVDKIPAEEVCGFAAHADHSKYPVPNVIHFCQRYGTGKYFFTKRKVPHDIFTCESPLMLLPPPDSAAKYDYRISPDGTQQELGPVRKVREAFAACAVIQAVNEASGYFKRKHCGDKANWDSKLNGSDEGMTQEDLDAEEEELRQRNQLKSETR